jgi:CubicO group peptidase (beta-lactamase class C family)
MFMAKTIIGVAIDDGFINSERDSISQYIREIVQRPENPVTLRDLLSHASGIESAFEDTERH